MARDIIHNAVRRALENDGWTITDDPLQVEVIKQEKHYQIDLGAEKVIGAEKGDKKIAVEIKSFASHSVLNAFHGVLGQYLNYLAAMELIGMDRVLYLAISEESQNRLKKIDFIQKQISNYHINVIIVDIEAEKIKKWIE